MKTPEHRRDSRIVSEFWVAVEGVDEGLQRRVGNISTSGIYFRVDETIGEPGSVQWLHVTSLDRTHAIEIMARVIRVVAVHDLHRGNSVVGAALEFLPENSDKRVVVERLVQKIVSMQLKEQLPVRIDENFSVHVDRKVRHKSEATVPRQIYRMTLETTWPLNVGEVLRGELQSGASYERMPISAHVMSVSPTALPDGTAGLRVGLDVEPAMTIDEHGGEVRKAASSSIAEGVDSIFDDLMLPELTEDEHRHNHLVGSLERIRLPSLLTFLELERLSGQLKLDRGSERATLYVRDGRLLDVETTPQSGSPRDAMTELFHWDNGHFEFFVGPVRRDDRFEMTMTNLILDLAREHDELHSDSFSPLL